ncbi:TadE/TadG family type IV pilus assembly protein [Sphingomicrobium sp. XHP0239]|uniref:TadE/TadG family type IV pilus assembly protein n=1 Tax=Sphingomicrobium maritimum TaxID=3133972 RepID=UPI0031CC55F0
MMRVRRLFSDTAGTAAAELAMSLPFVLVLVAGAFEMGHYFYSEHRLVEGVRDAARFAGRHAQNQYDGNCGTTLPADNDIVTDAELIASKGTLDATADDLLWGWNQGAAAFTISVVCAATADDGDAATADQTMGGIYRDSTVGAPLVTVTASIPHPTVFGYIGVPLGLTLNATSQSAVMGI